MDTAVGRVGVMICYDLEFPEWVRLAALNGADLIAAPVNWPYAARPAGERPAEVIKAQAGAATNGVFVAVADRCQDERGVSWISGSLIVGPDGYPLAGPVLADRPAVLTAACDLAQARDKSLAGDNDLLADRRPASTPSRTPEPEQAKDERVAAANAHWAARFIANGTSYSDFQATMARITTWDDWCREWGRTAQHYEQLAEAAEAAGRPSPRGRPGGAPRCAGTGASSSSSMTWTSSGRPTTAPWPASAAARRRSARPPSRCASRIRAPRWRHTCGSRGTTAGRPS